MIFTVRDREEERHKRAQKRIQTSHKRNENTYMLKRIILSKCTVGRLACRIEYKRIDSVWVSFLFLNICSGFGKNFIVKLHKFVVL